MTDGGSAPRDWLILVRPQAYAHTLIGVVIAAACALVLLLVFIYDVSTATRFTIGAISLLPVMAAAWLLSLRVTIAITIFASLLRAIAIVSGLFDPAYGVAVVTGLSQLLLVPILAYVTRLASSRVELGRTIESRSAFVTRVARIATSADTLGTILPEVLAEMARQGLGGGLIALIDERDELYVAAADRPLLQGTRQSRLKLGEGTVGAAAAEGRSLLVKDVGSSRAGHLEAPWPAGGETTRSMAVVPLRAAGKVIGIVELESPARNRFDGEDLQLLEQVAVAVSGAVQRAGSLQLADQQLQRRVKELSLLLEAAQTLTASLDLERIYETAARLASEVGYRARPGTRRGALLKMEGAAARRIAIHDEMGVETEDLQIAVDSSPVVRQVIETGVPIIADGAALGPEFELRMETSRVSQMALAPVRTRFGLFGMLAVATRGEAKIEPSELELLEGLAQLVGLAIANAENLTHEVRRVRELSSLLEAARLLSASLDLEEIYRNVVRLAAETVLREESAGRRRSSLLRIDGDRAIPIAVYDEMGQDTQGREVSVSRHPGIAEAMRSGHAATVRLSDLQDGASPADRETMAILHFTAGIYAPVRSGSELFGVLTIVARDDREFEPGELRLAEGIANLAGLALSNAERLRLELSRSEELRQHGRRTAALERAKSEFLRLASHELRGPLAVLRGYLAMIEEGSLGPLPSSMAGVFPILVSKLEEMNLLIDQMLETARLEDSSLQLNMEQLDLGAIVTAAFAAMKPFAPGNHELRLDNVDGAVPIRGDANRLNTILVNLIGNAIKYSPDGGEVLCRVERGPATATVSVSDHGLGIDPGDLPRLFTRFGRIVTPENSHIPGTGLGLYLARELARMHGGDIQVRSQLGSGSTFTLTLPVAVELLSSAEAKAG